MNSTLPSKQVDYGQDAPGVRLGMFAIGCVGFLTLVAVLIASKLWRQFPSGAGVAMLIIGVLLLLYGTGMGAYMHLITHKYPRS